LKEAQLVQPGEILVAQMTSPGWTPLFSVIGAIITEEGGILSHSSVVAREFHIPAVIQVDNATKLLKNAQLVTVNGFDGKITIHESS
jgi:rifampicin phosphotransferase